MEEGLEEVKSLKWIAVKSGICSVVSIFSATFWACWLRVVDLLGANNGTFSL